MMLTRPCLVAFLLVAAVSFVAGEYGDYGDDTSVSEYGYDGVGEDLLGALEGLAEGMDGDDDDFLGGDDDDDDDLGGFMMDEALMGTGMMMMEQCGISFEKVMETGASLSPSDPSGAMDAISSFLSVVGNKCPPQKESDFKAAMNSFESCAGIDLMEIIQTLPSAILGMELMCLQSVLKQVSAGDDSTDPVEFGEECAESLYGTNPLGNLIRSLYLRPDHTIPCFKALSSAVPDCTLPMWPMPVVGSWLKDFTCLVGAVSSFLDPMCEAELDVLDACLGQGGNQCNAANVDCVEQDSSMFTLPAPLLGSPVSDACRRVAESKGMLGVVDRYEKTTRACIEAWPGWDEDFTVSMAVKSYKAPTVGTTTLASSASGSTMTSAVSKQNVMTKEDNSTDSGTSGFTFFMYGVGSGLALVGVAAVLISMRRKGGGRRRGFNSVEMVESNMVMA
jgi:hypothetical protein